MFSALTFLILESRTRNGEDAVRHLGNLVGRLVCLGGCATGLLLTDVAAPSIRYTCDVDVITEVATLAEHYRLNEERGKGKWVVSRMGAS